jgi:hypothetical protein
MEEIKLIKATDTETGWPVLTQESKRGRHTFRLDPNTNRYSFLQGIFPREWVPVPAENAPSVEAAFRKAYGPEPH